ncbi:MAG: hypothetical protein IPM35_33500 [Myxococcales bacterium]|nr:hypothetical protein [Myxococcales bacterium]
MDVRDFIATFARMMHIEDRFGVALRDLSAPVLARALSGPLLVVHDAADREVPHQHPRRPGRGRLRAARLPL